MLYILNEQLVCTNKNAGLWTETADVRQNNLEDMEREMIRCSRESRLSAN